MPGTATKRQMYDGLATVAKALGSGRRLEILDLLTQGPYSVGDLATELELPVANISSHLQVLHGAGLVRSHRSGSAVTYELSRQDVLTVLALVEAIAVQELPEVSRLVDRHLDRQTMASVSADEMARQLRHGSVLPLDARPEHDYRIGRLPGAQLLAESSLPMLHERVRGKSVVIYCRGPYCSLAETAIRVLRSHHIEAARLEGGYSSWKVSGYPIET